MPKWWSRSTLWQRVMLVTQLFILVVIVGSFFRDYSITWAILLNLVLLLINFVVSVRSESRKERPRNDTDSDV
ncbi:MULTISPECIES: hypothetical protein [unclassified Frondihabitans]|uniref:hypothetical protein n=1 Tax=unclassified Frondihabitans TaxID=2626248 RepID=UPI000F4FA3BB|nr:MULTISPECIES: hypothetical protein [unclassified Frondihabitans]RPE73822.1 hypothetical protein EDF37_3370 [Frondihabitans sp. PhB153]RPF04075.1 hypothetical protein EDF39_2494 [Frondihabitans sp. PhB161]